MLDKLLAYKEKYENELVLARAKIKVIDEMIADAVREEAGVDLVINSSDTENKIKDESH